MKLFFLTILLCNLSLQSFAQNENEPSDTAAYGKPHPEAPEQIKDYADLIGFCNCKSYSMGQDRKWGEAVDMTWEFKYIMNGTAVQDQTLKANGIHSGSIRQYNQDSTTWYVHYYSSSAAPNTLQTWEGGKQGDDIVLYKEEKAPNGMDGFYKIMFSDISKDGFKWLGQWVDPKETILFPLWKIDCTKVDE